VERAADLTFDSVLLHPCARFYSCVLLSLSPPASWIYLNHNSCGSVGGSLPLYLLHLYTTQPLSQAFTSELIFGADLMPVNSVTGYKAPIDVSLPHN
jgi:hypothetical protein